MTDIIQIQESEYDAILRQAVTVIDRTRAMVATTVCSAIGTAHWEIGKLLHDKKVESKHGSGVVNRLSYDLKERYPQMGVSPRNLWDMKKFYEVGIANFYPVQSLCKYTRERMSRQTTTSSRHYLPHRQCLPMRCSEAVTIWDSLALKIPS